MMIRYQNELPTAAIKSFCQRWKIVELALFGSVLREDFGADSDIDVLVECSAEAEWSLLDHVQMEQELGTILGRKVDLVSKQGIERSRNSIRRSNILTTAETIYAGNRSTPRHCEARSWVLRTEAISLLRLLAS